MRKVLIIAAALAVAAILSSCASTGPKEDAEDRFAEYVWPPPPDEARIRLVDVIYGRANVELESRIDKVLFGASPRERFDWLRKPFAVEYDGRGRILVTDLELAGLLRFDLEARRVDVFGTTGLVTLRLPFGIGVDRERNVVYVADGARKTVVAFDETGKIVSLYGREGELLNPTDAEISPDGRELYVADSKAHKIVVFDVETAEVVRSFGRRGEGEGEFHFPTSLKFSPEGALYVVDQLNARLQVVDREGRFIDSLGGRGTGFGKFVRPKDVAIDAYGLIYVTDAAFNNVQLFDADFTLLTFVGEGGPSPGRFLNASGVAVYGDRFAVVDQLGHRLQLFRFLESRGGE